MNYIVKIILCFDGDVAVLDLNSLPDHNKGPDHSLWASPKTNCVHGNEFRLFGANVLPLLTIGNQCC